MVRITVCLQDDERMALLKLAREERREPRSQAAVLIRNELERRGLLIDTAVPTISKVEEAKHANNTG